MRALALALGLLGALGCGEADDAAADTLTGSVSRIYSLHFDTTRARLSQGELAIQYADGGESVAQVVVRLDAPVSGPGTVDLTTRGAVIGRRGAVLLPDFVEGTLTLADYAPTGGAPVRGGFEAQLEAVGVRYSVRGTFDTTLDDLR